MFQDIYGYFSSFLFVLSALKEIKYLKRYVHIIILHETDLQKVRKWVKNMHTI